MSTWLLYNCTLFLSSEASDWSEFVFFPSWSLMPCIIWMCWSSSTLRVNGWLSVGQCLSEQNKLKIQTMDPWYEYHGGAQAHFCTACDVLCLPPFFILKTILTDRCRPSWVLHALAGCVDTNYVGSRTICHTVDMGVSLVSVMQNRERRI